MSEENNGHVVRVHKNGEVREFGDVIGHQVGYGSVQVLFEDGSQVIINNYDEVEVVLTESQQEDFKKGLAQKKLMQKAVAAQQEAAE